MGISGWVTGDEKSRRIVCRWNGIASLLFCWFGIAAGTAMGQSDKSSPSDFESVAKKYELEIVSAAPMFPAKTSWGLIEGTAAEAADLKRYESLFCQEFKLYPKSFVAKSRLRRVVLCQNLMFAGQRRYAIPDFEHDAYYLDVGTSEQSAIYLRKVIHHDFFHLVDYRDDGLLYEDERWKELNPVDFKYGTGGAAALGIANTGELTDKFPGFLNHYSTTGVEEDKAEVFAHLIVSSHIVASRIESDPVLSEKVARIKALVHAFCSDMDESFWELGSNLPR